MTWSRCRGFLAIESMVVALIVLLLLVYTLYVIGQTTERSDRYFNDQSRFNRLVSVADYIVKNGAAAGTTDTRYPNWIDEDRLEALDREALAERIGLDEVEADWTPGSGTCLFRLVVVGQDKEIRKLYVCGR